MLLCLKKGATAEGFKNVRSVDLETFGILKQLQDLKHKVDKYPFASPSSRASYERIEKLFRSSRSSPYFE